MIKDNFLLKLSQIKVFNELSDEDAGKLIKGIFEYANSKKIMLDGYLKIIFIPIKEEIDKNEARYELVCEKNKKNGKLGGRPKNPKKPNGFSENPKKPINHNHTHNHIHNQIIDYLNNKTNSNFKYTTKSTQQKINARLNEGYKLDDFIVVIDKKYNEWVGTDFEQYLVPETLFGTKFEKYLNQKETKKSEPMPSWFNTNVENKKATAEEQKEMEELLKEFN